jgi:hypothetical protein
MLGDIHARGHAERLREHLENSNIIGYVKLNADLGNIMTTSKAQSNNTTGKDVIILCGGSRNIRKNETNKGPCSTLNLRRTKALIMEAPRMHDLISTSCINKEVDTFNRKLQKIAKNFEHAEIAKISNKREYFTRHGLHMNGSGKGYISSSLATKILQLLTTQKPKPPVPLRWTTETRKRSGM